MNSISFIRKQLRLNSTPETKEKAERLTSGSLCIGVSVPIIRALAKNYRSSIKGVSFEQILSAADELFSSKCREEILFAVFLLSSYKKDIPNIDWLQISSWLDYIDNWETCDQLSAAIVAPVFCKFPERISLIYPLHQDKNHWKRRFLAATAANINHKGYAFPSETFHICSLLIEDKELQVSKAVGWALREISKSHPLETIHFIKKNRVLFSKRLYKESITNFTLEEKKLLD